jgi:hypothetical protein
MMEQPFTWDRLDHEPLCVADFHVEGPILSLGQSPFSDRRVGYITGGSFEGARLKGEILPGGGNWSQNGALEPDVACGLFDARSLWRTANGGLIHVTYTGRSVIPKAASVQIRDPEVTEVDPASYYIRIAPVFETSDPEHLWLNGILAVGCGQWMPWGIRHWIFAIR